MTEYEWQDLIDLAVAGELPEALQAKLDAQLQVNPDRLRDYATLQDTAEHLKAAQPSVPDNWFVERTLDGLLREHFQARAEDNNLGFINNSTNY